MQKQKKDFETQRELLDSVTSQLDEARKEIEGMKAQETKRLETLETKVKETLFAKDQTIQHLKDELSASKTKASDHKESYLERVAPQALSLTSQCN